MAVQKSVLSEPEISKLLKNNYGISADKIQRLHLGTANCFKVFSKDTPFFLKEYQEAFSEGDLRCETALNKFLLSQAFPTAEFIKDENGNTYNFVNGRYVVLQEYIESESYVNHDLPDSLLFQAAEILAQLHEILIGYNLPVEMDVMWVKEFSVSQTYAKYDYLLDFAQNVEDKAIRYKISEDLIFKKGLIKLIKPYGEYFDKLIYKSTHGDYNSMQYLCAGDIIKAIIDFASAKKIPAVWEIMRSYMQSASDTKDPFDFDVSKFCEYVRCYMRFSALTEFDLKYMPYVYLYQLGRSGYGYKEYMTDAESKDEFLKFAFWRTDICRMLLNKADDISAKLTAL